MLPKCTCAMFRALLEVYFLHEFHLMCFTQGAFPTRHSQLGSSTRDDPIVLFDPGSSVPKNYHGYPALSEGTSQSSAEKC